MSLKDVLVGEPESIVAAPDITLAATVEPEELCHQCKRSLAGCLCAYANTDLRGNLSSFHAAMEIEDPERPCIPPDEKVRLRARLVAEECFEVLFSLFRRDSRSDLVESFATIQRFISEAPIGVDLAEFADGLADLGRAVSVCIDPVRQPDKPMPTNCAWRYCARATGGAHNPDENGDCKNCGKPAIAPKWDP